MKDHGRDYDMGTGEFNWKEPAPGRPIGRLAGTLDGDSYRIIRVEGIVYKAHRLSWMRCHNQDPGEMQVDHINGDGLDNHISNLRLVSNTSNGRNTSISRHNTSGFNGVNREKASGKWRARINVSGKKISLGLFTDKDDAIAARQAANEQYGFHPNHGRAAA